MCTKHELKHELASIEAKQVLKKDERPCARRTERYPLDIVT